MKEIEKIMREILAICPDVKPHLVCLGDAIRKELNKKEQEIIILRDFINPPIVEFPKVDEKEKEKQMDLIRYCDNIKKI